MNKPSQKTVDRAVRYADKVAAYRKRPYSVWLRGTTTVTGPTYAEPAFAKVFHRTNEQPTKAEMIERAGWIEAEPVTPLTI